jgi:group I intron endonuclease
MIGVQNISSGIGGIYAIVHPESGRLYIGSSVNVRKRLNSHRRKLELEKHDNIILQGIWNKYGKDSLFCCLVEIVSERRTLLEREQYWMDAVNPSINILKFADSRKGHKQSAETVEKRVSAFRGKPQSEESKKRKSEAQKGRRFTQEHINNMVIGFKTRPTALYAKLEFRVTNPSGEPFIVFNLSEFCRENKLSRPHLISVARGRRSHHKNWKCSYAEALPDTASNNADSSYR